MLIGIYDGVHYLDLDTLFRDVSWYHLYGIGESTGDPLVRSLSNFKRIASELDIQIESIDYWRKYRNKRLDIDNYSYLFVISGHPLSLQVDEILEAVKEGSNLLVISPPWQFEFFHLSSFKIDHDRFLRELNLEIGCKLEEEKETAHGSGRIFYIDNADEINDLSLESNPFGGNDLQEKRDKEERIKSLIQKISTFNVPCIDCQVRSLPACWPKEQPLYINIDIIQRCNSVLNHVTINVDIPNSFEPLQSVEIYLDRFEPKRRSSHQLLVIPRKKKLFIDPLEINLHYEGKKSTVILPKTKIEIIDIISNINVNSHPDESYIFSSLSQYEPLFQQVITSKELIALFNTNRDSFVAYIRRIGEHLCKSIANKRIPDYKSDLSFAKLTYKLGENSILSKKAKGYIETIRAFGNIAAHADEKIIAHFDRDEALSICYALVVFLKNIKEDRLL